ncbi:serine O-acetyltransferase [Aureococcus anophagefferens]|nr:serine O-acetyltransferase [Aureococcus anophagefferens]
MTRSARRVVIAGWMLCAASALRRGGLRAAPRPRRSRVACRGAPKNWYSAYTDDRATNEPRLPRPAAQRQQAAPLSSAPAAPPADEDDEAQLARLPYSDEERARDDRIFARLLDEAAGLEGSPLLGPAVQSQILKSEDLADAVGEVLACRLARAASDPAAISYLQCVMFFKGFHATQAQRVSADFWRGGDLTSKHVALAIQNRVSELWAVDIHPAASLGGGLLMDHATGIVIGETAVIGDNCTILHSVTLGGTGKDRGDRHPKVGDRCTLGAGATVLGNIRVGDGATVGSQAVVTKDVPTGMTVIGLNKLLDPEVTPERKQEVQAPGTA